MKIKIIARVSGFPDVVLIDDEVSATTILSIMDDAFLALKKAPLPRAVPR
jgi:hypothetical protein